MKIKTLFNFRYLSIFVVFFLFHSNFAYSQTCNCKEYLYLNEPSASGNPGIHKFELNENFNPATDMASASISQEIGNPWFNNGTANETIINPHGISADLNGNIYVGESANIAVSNIRKLRCDGTVLPTTEFIIPNEGGFNFASTGNTLFVNTNSTDDAIPNYVQAYDLCTGDLIGFYCFNGISGRLDWGLYLEDDGTMLVTSDLAPLNRPFNAPNSLYTFNINNVPLNAVGEANPVCIDPLISEGATPPAVNSNLFPRDRIYGVTMDSQGFIYVVEESRPGDPDFPANGVDRMSKIYKYDSSGNLVAVTPFDDVDGDGGYFAAIGIYYSKALDLIFVSTQSPLDDCVSLFDTNLNYLGPAVPSPANGTASKGIHITTECCTTSTPIVEDITLCDPILGEKVFLLDLIGCSLCEGVWSADPAQNDFNFDSCDNSIVIDALNDCGSFTITSDGTGPSAQCGAFDLTIDVCTAATPAAPAISITDNVCEPETAGSINIDTPCAVNSSIQYSTDGGTTWLTAPPAYVAATAVTVRARCVSDISDICSSEETADVTSAPEQCCPPVNCINSFGEFSITKRKP